MAEFTAARKENESTEDWLNRLCGGVPTQFIYCPWPSCDTAYGPYYNEKDKEGRDLLINHLRRKHHGIRFEFN